MANTPVPATEKNPPTRLRLGSNPAGWGERATRDGEFLVPLGRSAARRDYERRRRLPITAKSPKVGTQPTIDIALGGAEDGVDVLPVSVFDAPDVRIESSCPKWSDSADVDQMRVALYEVMRNGQPASVPFHETPFVSIDDLPDPMIIEFDASALPTVAGQDQVFVLRFIQGNEFSDQYPSQDYRFRADRRAPGGEQLLYPHIDQGYIDNGLTLNDLAANGGKLDIEVYPYTDQKKADEIIAHLKAEKSSTTISTAPATVDVVGKTITVEFTQQALLDAEIDGPVDLWVTAEDQAGNVAQSQMVRLDTLLFGAPTDFEPIAVPLHDDNGNLLNDERARRNPEFEVPACTNLKIGDQVRVHIRRSGAGETEDDIIYDDFRIREPGDPMAIGELSYAELNIIRNAVTADQVFDFAMTYDIRRGKFVIDSRQTTTINCDLTLAGGPDIDPATPIHENLRPPTISGNNIVDTDEFGSDVPTLVPYLAVDGSDVFNVNDALDLFVVNMDGSDRVSVLGAPVAVGNPAADVTTIVVRPEFLVVGTMYFQYSVTRAISNGETNTAWSPIQQVEVKSAGDLPGGGNPIPLQAQAFRDANQIKGTPVRPSYQWSRSGDSGDALPYEGMLIRIYQYLNMAVGDKIEVTLEGSTAFPDYDATQPIATPIVVPPHTVTEADLQPKISTAIPEDALPGTNPPSNEPRVFVDFKVPYSEMEKIDRNGTKAFGSVRLSVKVTNAAGGTGSSDPAVVLFASVDARRP